MSQSPDRRLGGMVALTTLIGFGLLALVGGGFTHPGHAAAGTDAYTRLVRSQFIDRQRLVVRRDVEDNAGVPVVDLAPEIYRGDDPIAWQYAASSFLLQDIRLNNPSIWTIENGKVTDIDTFAHLTPAPFADRRNWHGRVFFRNPPPAQADDDVVLVPRGWAGPKLRLTENDGRLQTGDSRIHTLVLTSPGLAEISAPAIDIYCRANDPTPVVRLERIGDQAGVLAEPAARCEVEAGGRSLTRRDFEAVGLGNRFVISAGPRRTYTFERIHTEGMEGAMSAPTASGDRARAPEINWWSLAIEHDYVRALPRAPDQAMVTQNIRTSLDPVLQRGAQQMLDDFIAGLEPAPGDLRIAAVTVMNARTGEVLAMASSPHVPVDPRDIVDRDDPIAKAARLNQNLQLLPIGSAAKPMMAAAILSEHPALLSLKIPAQHEIDDLLGMPIHRLGNHAVGTDVDFDSFIKNSDNIYAATLLLLASADRGTALCRLAPGERYQLSGSKWLTTTRSKSVFEKVGADGECHPSPPGGLRQLTWADRLNGIFDVNVSARGMNVDRYRYRNCSAGGGLYGDDTHEGTPWRQLFEAAPALAPCRMIESTPVREALAIDAARNFRTDLLPVMLGNGEGRWTAVKVAEAYSRLVTGRRVAATFMPSNFTAFTPLSEFTMQVPLTHAMTLVPSGTAAQTDLPAALSAIDARLRAAGLVLGAFAKTGTPVALKADYTAVDKAINLLIEHGLVTYDEGNVRLQLQSLASVLLTPDSHGEQISLAARALDRERIFQEASERFGVDSRTVLRTLINYTRQTRAGHQPFVVERGALLVRVGARRDDGGDDDDDDELPHGKVLALVLGAYDPAGGPPGTPTLAIGSDGRAANAAAEPACAYTVVVTLQFPTKGRANAAADLAARVAQRFLAERLVCPVRRGGRV